MLTCMSQYVNICQPVAQHGILSKCGHLKIGWSVPIYEDTSTYTGVPPCVPMYSHTLGYPAV